MSGETMLQRILSLFGVGWDVPRPSFSASSNGSAPNVDGGTQVVFTPGPRSAMTAEEAAEALDERRASITDDDLVWPGKTTTVHWRNDDPVAYRYDLTITDLPLSFYVCRPPLGGALQMDQSVLLQPGEEAAFEVTFVPPPSAARYRSQTFSFVMSRFDPRRSQDAGQIVADLPARWVNMPGSADFRLTAGPKEVILRPWRRTALVRLSLENRSNLAPDVRLSLRRAGTKAELADPQKSEEVGSVVQSLDARTSGVWHCVLPPDPEHPVYVASATGSARVAGSVEHALALDGPVLVRYVPWLRRGRDWAVLLCGLFLLVYLAWGIPFLQTPVVRLTPVMSPPQGASLDDLAYSLTPLRNNTPGSPVPGVADDRHTGAIVFRLPSQWAGSRWPFGGVHTAGRGLRFKIAATVLNSTTEPQWKDRYVVGEVLTDPDTHRFFEVSGRQRPFSTEWNVPVRGTLAPASAMRVNIVIDDFGAATGQDVKTVKLLGTLDGDKVLEKEWPVQGGKGPVTIPATLETKAVSGQLTLTATTAPYQMSVGPTAPALVKKQPQPTEVHLRFGSAAPQVALKFPAVGVPYAVHVYSPPQETGTDLIPPGQNTSTGGAMEYTLNVAQEGVKVLVTVETLDGTRIGGGPYELKTSQPEIVVDVKPPPIAPPGAPAGTSAGAPGAPGSPGGAPAGLGGPAGAAGAQAGATGGAPASAPGGAAAPPPKMDR